MKIDYTDRFKETLLIPGVDAKWLEGHTLEEILNYSVEKNVHPNQAVLDELGDYYGILTYKGLPIETSSSGCSSQLNQLTKLNVIAPKEVTILIDETYDFNLPDVNILKFKPGLKNIIHSTCDFNNNDNTDFEENNYIIFDGTMRPKMFYEFNIIQEEDLFKTTINKSKLNITRIEMK